MSRAADLYGVRILFGVVLLVAGLTKLFAMGVFQSVVALSDIVPKPATPAWRGALSAGIALGAPYCACHADPLPVTALAQDARLSRKITVVAERAYLGDLVPALLRASQVPVTLDDRNRAGDPRLTVYAREARVFDVLNAIWSTLSYRGAEWHWSVEGKAQSVRYRLSRPMRAAQVGTTLCEWVESEFAHQAEVYLAAASLDPESRRALLTQHAPSLYPSDQRDRMLSTALSGQRKWDGLALFNRTFAPGERSGILSGQSSGKMPVTDLGEDAVTFARSIWERERVMVSVDGAPPVRRAMPTHIEFSTEAQGPLGTPCLMIWMHREDGRSGYAYLGGMPIALRLDRMISDLWSLDGDSPGNPAGERNIPGDPKDQDRANGTPSLLSRLRRLARSAPVNVVALLPSSAPVDLPDPVGCRLDQYLALLKDQAGIMSKRRNGVLVLSSQGWFREESAETPWRAVKRLREMQSADSSGIVGLDGLAWMVRELTPAQLARFAREYSGANAALAIRELLLLQGATPGFVRALAASGGLRLTSAQCQALRSGWSPASSLPSSEPVLRITMRMSGAGAKRVDCTPWWNSELTNGRGWCRCQCSVGCGC